MKKIKTAYSIFDPQCWYEDSEISNIVLKQENRFYVLIEQNAYKKQKFPKNISFGQLHAFLFLAIFRGVRRSKEFNKK